ncbi:MAG: bifunctional phosphopantothenoylcysteine decarboxylase/phosphopantothenate--cysteine ligase CoaBC [Anaerolineae bacterium]|nr:bifunctional phosphopantothenoylcysteine decarboxylase/phosphopantothenate--cysteine ligase CoaBC [Anaerolineae bacterium]
MTVLENKHILLGVTGSIAVYKAVDLASKLTQAGAHVTVIMTKAAQRFVSPLTFESVTGHPAYTDLWRSGSGELPTHITHIGLGEDTDLLVIAPATANTLAKLATGLADDLLSITVLAARCPVIIAPAMDGAMYEHPATQSNLATLRGRDIILVDPEEGRFASGMVGRGRLPETPTLMGHIRRVLGRQGSLRGRRVIVTAGGTQEALDPVRYLTNRSTGKQGYALAQAALDAGADVTLISATGTLPTPIGATLVPVTSAQEMLAAVEANLSGADVLIMAAAVADFRPAIIAERKIKKGADENQKLTIELVRNPDILLTVKRLRQETGWPRVTIGFAAESEDLEENARAKLEAKGLDLIVANDITAADAGFAADTNRVILLDRRGRRQALELASKMRISEAIISRAAALLGREA